MCLAAGKVAIIMKIHLFVISLMSMSILGCSVNTDVLRTVPEVNLEQYRGLWYEIAAFPQKFQKGCRCTTAEYELTGKNYIRVINKCQKPGKFAMIEGKAFVVKNSGNAKLKVQFFWPFKGDYWIIELDPEYKWAAVGNKSRKYLWILSRRPTLQDSIFNEILGRLTAKGFDVSKLKKTQQDCK
jgi:apolipoprotein D and lipocalin family protein